jgi:acyl-CoA synthetase (AMP-forming)/AMP-acid ligase II/acyl carrier protein
MAVQTLTDVLRARADQQPGTVAYESVDHTGRVSALSYGQLAARSAALAGRLAASGDGAVLLAYPAGLDYVVAVFAGFLAGRPVIPAYPSGPSSIPDRTRLSGIIADARPSVVVAPQDHPELGAPVMLTVPGAEADDTDWTPLRPADQDVAIIQYTSGSTGSPRGVLVRHDSLAGNTAAISERFELTSAARGVTWLPPFHDMGLVGGLLTPMMTGFLMRIMQPGDFLKSPLWWLRQISETGATVSGGPNFAYDLCVRRIRDDDALAELDLSRWRAAFSGGESVKHRTLTAFTERFAAAGFQPSAFLPCYGLAEATLMVSAGRWSPPVDDQNTTVSCGTPVTGQRVRVVDPQALTPVPDGEEGEIWIAGPHITQGYLAGDSSGLFGELDDERFLRTGDLGHLRDGEVVVTGRAKEVIVFRGANFHAIDVESAALDAAGTAAGTAAAFLIDSDTEELTVLVLEVRGKPDPALAARVRAAVLARTRLPLGLVALVRLRSVPRTSSGKVRRSACRDALLAGAYDDAAVSDPARFAALTARGTRQSATTELAALICGVIAGVREIEDCRPTDSLTDLGVDSVQAAEAAAVLEDALGLSVPIETVLTAPTPGDVADALVLSWLAAGTEPARVRDRLAMAGNDVGVA